GDDPESRLIEHQLALRRGDVVAVDRVAIGGDVVGAEIDRFGVASRKSVTGARALLMVHLRQGPAIGALQVEPGIFLAADIARQREEPAIGRDPGQTGRVLTFGELYSAAFLPRHAPDVR